MPIHLKCLTPELHARGLRVAPYRKKLR